MKSNIGTKVSFMVISDYAFVGEGGKPAIIGIFDILGVPTLPAGHPEMFVVANIKGGTNTEHEVELRLEDPAGENLLTPNPPKLTVRLSGTGSGNLIQRFLNLAFRQAGLHKFVLLIDGKQAGEALLKVIKIAEGDAGRKSQSN